MPKRTRMMSAMLMAIAAWIMRGEIAGDADAADHAALVPPYRSGDSGTSPIVIGSFGCTGFSHL
jgi:hypothetical protein